MNENPGENRTFLTSIFFLLFSAVTLIGWLILPSYYLFFGISGGLAFVVGVAFAVYAARLATEPSETSDVVRAGAKASASPDDKPKKAMRKAAGS
jgi:hypothetical protein